MEYLEAFKYLHIPMILLVVLGFILCADVLHKSVKGKRIKPVYLLLSILSFSLPISFFVFSKYIVTGIVWHSATDLDATLQISPAVDVEPRKLLDEILNNLYTTKASGGSHPTANKYIIKICSSEYCFNLEAAQDSRDLNMYWVGYVPVVGSNLPLGFTRIENTE